MISFLPRPKQFLTFLLFTKIQSTRSLILLRFYFHDVRKLRFRDGLVWMVGLTALSNFSWVAWTGPNCSCKIDWLLASETVRC